MIKAQNLRDLDSADLQRQAQEAQEQMFRIRFQMGMGQTDGLKKYRVVKKDRARMLTVLKEKGEVAINAPVVKATAAKAAAKNKKK